MMMMRERERGDSLKSSLNDLINNDFEISVFMFMVRIDR
jgi:hypothetical protein